MKIIDSPFWKTLQLEIYKRNATYEIVRIDGKGVYVRIVKDRL